MDKNRLFMILLGVAMAAVLAGGFLLGVRPSLDSASASEQAREAAAASNQANQALLNSLIEQNKKIGELTDQVNVLRQSVPSQENLEQFIDTVDVAAAAQGLIVQNVTPGGEIAYAPQGVSTPPAGGATPPSTATATPTPTPTPSPSATAAATPAAGASPQAPATHTDPQITAANFLAVPIKVGVAGPLPQTIAFIHALQNGPRLFVVSGISGGASTSSGAGGSKPEAAQTETYVVSGYVYVLTSATAATASK
jgi:hypothetical protein